MALTNKSRVFCGRETGCPPERARAAGKLAVKWWRAGDSRGQLPQAPESVPVLTDQRSLPHRWPKAATVNKPVNTETTTIFFRVLDTMASHFRLKIETRNKSPATRYSRTASVTRAAALAASRMTTIHPRDLPT